MATQEVYVKGTEKAKTREERGLRLYREMGEEIEHAKGNVWLVPSCTVDDYFYAVDLSIDECECPDSQHGHGEPCKHVFGARIALAKSAMCDGCRRRFPRRELTEVTEDHESLTWFVTDRLCATCAVKTGVL